MKTDQLRAIASQGDRKRKAFVYRVIVIYEFGLTNTEDVLRNTVLAMLTIEKVFQLHACKKKPFVSARFVIAIYICLFFFFILLALPSSQLSKMRSHRIALPLPAYVQLKGFDGERSVRIDWNKIFVCL